MASFVSVKWVRSWFETLLPLGFLLLALEAIAWISQKITLALYAQSLPFGIQAVVATLSSFVMLNIPLVLAERFFPGTADKRGYWRGIKNWIVYTIITYYWLQTAAVIIAALKVTPLFEWKIGTNSESLASMGLGAIALLLPVFAFDFFYYWFHRAQHRFDWLWRVHKVHHSIRDMNCLNSYHHVLEEVIRFPVVALPLALLLKVDAPQMIFISAFITSWGQYIHSDTSIHLGKLNGFFADNAFHRIHHSIAERHYDKNFASFFSVWDKLFGTYVSPELPFPDVGLTDTPPPKSVVRYLLMPFR
jgi:sterol desaturase/sphingolipid hydroxylase (fatty acid hydroxylase superfamily)